MNFGEALTHLKSGSKVRCGVWDKREYLHLKNGLLFKHSVMLLSSDVLELNSQEYEVDYFWMPEKGCDEILASSWELM
jgi:hypothetical protein